MNRLSVGQGGEGEEHLPIPTDLLTHRRLGDAGTQVREALEMVGFTIYGS